MDKPVGPTSHDVVAAVRRAFGTRRVGHTGTLDPFASGLLPVLVGQGTRLARFLSPLSKTYVATMRLGLETDTLDATGQQVAERSVAAASLARSELERVFAEFLGHQEQVPPAFSAKKINGVPAHRRVRRGESVEIAPVAVVVEEISLLGVGGTDVTFRARVSSGTYVRALARDIGARLETGAHLTALRRTRVGPFSIDDALALDELGEAGLSPLVDAVGHLPAVAVDASTCTDVLHGRVVHAPEPHPPFDSIDTVAVTCDGELVAVAEPVGDDLQPRVVIAG